MTIEQVIRAALPVAIEEYLGAPPYTLERLQENVYCLRSAAQRLFLKWILADDWHGHNEIRVNRKLQATPFYPAPRLLFSVAVNQATLAGWEWAAGTDLRLRQREALPRAFAALGRFHAEHRNSEAVCSPETYAQYPSVRAMLRAELTVLTAGLERAVTGKCAEAFGRLEDSYVTCIHGDLHPGNIRVTARGVQFVDWGYATNSLNLFDLGYVRRHAEQELDGTEWWHIRPCESDAVLAAYFAECDMGELDWGPLQLAVEVWSTLYAFRNALTRQNDVEVANSLDTLHVLLAHV